MSNRCGRAKSVGAFPALSQTARALPGFITSCEYLLMELDRDQPREDFQEPRARFVPAGEFFVTDVSDHFALFPARPADAGIDPRH